MRKGSKTYVLVHGAWHGGWCWRDVADRLRGQGYHVTTPTQTGLGERRHLLGPGIVLDTFVNDIVNHFDAEELDDVILVGHSLGGATITGVADRIGDRIRHLVYLDGVIVESGRSAYSMVPPETVAARRKLVEAEGQGYFLPVPSPAMFGIPDDHPLADWVRRRLTPHPAGTFETALTLAHPVGNGRPITYIACSHPFYANTESSRQWVKDRGANKLGTENQAVEGRDGWTWIELATAHDAMILAPDEVASLLAAVE